jgi:hypothetical protein
MINLPPMTSLILDQIRPFGKVTEVREGLPSTVRPQFFKRKAGPLLRGCGEPVFKRTQESLLNRIVPSGLVN